MKKSATEREQDFPVKWFKFIYPSSKPRLTETSTLTPVHVAYSPIAFMNHQWTINLHDGYPPLHVLLPEEYIPPSLPTLCNLKSTMFHFGIDLLHSTTKPQHDLPSLASPKGEMASSSVGLVLSRVPHQALYVLVTLHLQSLIKSSCYVKLIFVSPSLFLFVTLLLMIEFLDFNSFIPFLQCVQLVFPRCLCVGNRGFGSEGLKQVKMPLHRKQRVDTNRCEFLPKTIALFYR